MEKISKYSTYILSRDLSFFPFSEFQTPISSHLLEIGCDSLGGLRFIIFNSTYLRDPSELKAIVCGLLERDEGILKNQSRHHQTLITKKIHVFPIGNLIFPQLLILKGSKNMQPRNKIIL